MQLLVTVAPAGRRIRQLRITTLATQAALQRVATLAGKLLFLISAAFQYVPSVASFCYSQQVHHCTRRTSGSPCQQPNPGKVRSETTSGVVKPAFMAGSGRLALLLAVFAAAVGLSSGQKAADGGELVQGASCSRRPGASRPRMHL